MEIKILKAGFMMEDAAERLYKRSKGFLIESMNLLFYPYLQVLFDVNFEKKKLQKLNKKIICLVDMHNERYSLAKEFGDYEDIDAPDNTVMPVRVDRENVIEKAPKEICYDVMAAYRVMNLPELKYDKDDLIYKPFYIVECKNVDEENFYILFDAVLGDFALINA